MTSKERGRRGGTWYETIIKWLCIIYNNIILVTWEVNCHLSLHQFLHLFLLQMKALLVSREREREGGGTQLWYMTSHDVYIMYKQHT